MIGTSQLINAFGAPVCFTDTTDIFKDRSGVALYGLDYDASDAGGASGKFGESAVLTGTSSQINFPNIPLSAFDAAAVSVSLWVNMQAVVSGYTSGSYVFRGRGNWIIQMISSGIVFQKYDTGPGNNGNNDLSYNFSGGTNLNQWYHIVVTDNGTSTSGLNLYVDGVLRDSNSGYANIDDNSWLAGIANYAGRAGGNFKVDQLRIFNKELLASEVTTLYNETKNTTNTLQILGDTSCIATYTFDGSSADLSGNYSGTDTNIIYKYDGTPTAVDFGVGGKSLYGARFNGSSSKNDTSNTYNGTPTDITYQGGAFDEAAVFNGSSSRIDTNFVSNLTSASYSFWVNIDSGTNGRIISSISANPIQDSQVNITLLTNGDLQFAVQAGGAFVSGTASGAINYGTWYHIVLTYSSGGYLKGYINGTEVSSVSIGTISAGSNTTPLYIGFYPRLSTYELPMSFDQLRIFNTELTQAQVTTLARGIATSYSGTNTNVNFNGHLDFQPDLVWTKCRSDAYDHNWVDSVRGINPNGTLYALSSNLTGTQTDSTNNVLSLDANGFTVQGTGSRTNAIGRDYVSWAWKAGGAAVSNTAGTITSQVSANKDSGFSIVKYTGNDVNGQSIGHGLSTSPELIIIKCLNVPEDWMVYTLPTGNAQKLYLNSSAAKAATGNMNNQTPTDDVFFVGGGTETGDLNDNYIAYCWHSVSGYSQIGSYSGTGSSGNAITGLGFQPNWLMVKRTDVSGGSWLIVDNRRVENNGNLSELFANTTTAETGTGYDIDFTSDGFTLNTTTSNANASGTNNYIYMAIA